MLALTTAPWPSVPQVLVILWRTVEDHDTLFVLAEASHFVGLGVLLYKLNTKQSCTGASLPALGAALLAGGGIADHAR